MLYIYGLELGFKLLFHGAMKHALPYLIRPVNYWRTAEYQAVWDSAEFTDGDRILDIGSPKLLSIYLAHKKGLEVYATDIEDYFVSKLELIRKLQKISPDRLHLQIEDGRRLSFADSYFNKVFAISVVEHIPESGDTECIREIARVLAPGGCCVLTVPFSASSRVEYTDGNFYWARSSNRTDSGRVFYQRRYSERDLYDRLIGPSGLSLRSLAYIAERCLTNSERELSDLLPVVSGPIQPVLSKLFHTPPTASWRELRKPLCAVLVLEKEEAGN